jgi:hypothetical protein
MLNNYQQVDKVELKTDLSQIIIILHQLFSNQLI